jgi:hypothetical protein
LRADLYSLCEGCDAGVIHVAASGSPEMVAEALEQHTSRMDRHSPDCRRCGGVGVVEVVTGHRVEKELCPCDGGRVTKQMTENAIPASSEYYQRGTVSKGLNHTEAYIREQLGHDGLHMEELIVRVGKRFGVAPDDCRSTVRQAAARGVVTRTAPPPVQPEVTA